MPCIRDFTAWPWNPFHRCLFHHNSVSIEINFTLIPFLVDLSLQVFAHGRTTQLSCYVHNFLAISSFEFVWEQTGISITYKLKLKVVSEIDHGQCFFLKQLWHGDQWFMFRNILKKIEQLRQPRMLCCHCLPPGSLHVLGAFGSLSCLCMSMLTPNSSGNMQKHGYWGCFHAASARENISRVWGIIFGYTLSHCGLMMWCGTIQIGHQYSAPSRYPNILSLEPLKTNCSEICMKMQ